MKAKQIIPGLSAMIVAAVVLMPWIGQRLLEYASVMFSGHMP
jgi:flagellar biosynthesis protein FliQ